MKIRVTEMGYSFEDIEVEESTTIQDLADQRWRVKMAALHSHQKGYDVYVDGEKIKKAWKDEKIHEGDTITFVPPVLSV